MKTEQINQREYLTAAPDDDYNAQQFGQSLPSVKFRVIPLFGCLAGLTLSMLLRKWGVGDSTSALHTSAIGLLTGGWLGFIAYQFAVKHLHK